MSAVEILSTLKRLGKAQTAVIYKRRGSDDDVFGTLTSEMANLQKKIKVNHTLAMELWRTSNADARILALLVSDRCCSLAPTQIDYSGMSRRADGDRSVQAYVPR